MSGSSNKSCGSAVVTVRKKRGIGFVRRGKAAQLSERCGECFRAIILADPTAHADPRRDDVGKRFGEPLRQSLKIQTIEWWGALD
ncbi:MAG TPA: hypothetical protein VGI47_07705 [Candidatus Binataceae bacterium]